MKNRALKAIAVFLTLTVLRPLAAAAGENPVDQPKRVLVELFTSQGCNSCPPASDLLGKLFELGDDRDQIVPLNFHVDYFNQPWPDPYSDASYTRRQRDYNSVQHRDDLQFTPLLMVDGRLPLLGSDRESRGGHRTGPQDAAEVALDLKLDGMGNRKTVLVKVAARSPEVAGRELLIGMALTEDPVKTKVLRGENAGLTLVEHHVVRRLDHRFLKLDRTRSRAFPSPSNSLAARTERAFEWPSSPRIASTARSTRPTKCPGIQERPLPFSPIVLAISTESSHDARRAALH